MMWLPDNPGVDPDDTPDVDTKRFSSVRFILLVLLIAAVVIGIATWAVKP